MSNLDHLQEKINAYQEILLCKRRLEIVKAAIHLQKSELEQLRKIVEKEHQDVLNLENSSLKQLFSTLLVNKQEQLEKEKQEYLLAALKHNECHKLIELLEYEKNLLTKKISKEKEATINFEAALMDYNPKKLSSAEKSFQVLKSINEELKNVILLKIETEEALSVIKELLISFKEILRVLKAANLYDNWGEFYKQKQLAKIKKKQYIDQAQSLVYLIRKQLIFLRSELVDVEEFQGVFSEAKGLVDSFNLNYYSDLISDWINVLKLEDTIEHTLTTYSTIKKLRAILKKMIKKSNQEYELLLIKRTTLIDQIANYIVSNH